MTKTTMDSKDYKNFLEELKNTSKIEEKLSYTLSFMKKNLSSEKPSFFRDFWEAKKICLELFKEKLPPRIRGVFWAEYLELSEEIRKIKEILDEESSFAKEQIDLATQGIEKDLKNYDSFLSEIVEVEIPGAIHFSQKKKEQLIQLQKDLELLNVFADRVHGLRKELIQISIKFRDKNQLFETLSQISHQIFPKRKEVSKELTTLFLEEIDEFIEKRFQLEKGPFYPFKEEIKALQKLAKELALNGQTFREVREKLSKCWDEIKEKETLLRKKPVPFKQKSEATPREKEQEEKKKQKESVDKFLNSLNEVLNQAEILSLDKLVEKWEALIKEEKEINLLGIHKAIMVHRLNSIADHIEEKKWKQLLEEGSNDSFSFIQSLLEERQKEKRKLKETLETHRKIIGGSNLNMEESILYQELVADEKIRLDTIETMIEEMEEKLFDLED